MRKIHRKNIFSSKILLSLKTYSVSSLNTKYEPLTPKTERVSLDFHPKITKMTIFHEKMVKFGYFRISRFRGQKIIFDKKLICVQKYIQYPVRMPNMSAGEQKLKKLRQNRRSPFLTIFSFFIFQE